MIDTDILSSNRNLVEKVDELIKVNTQLIASNKAVLSLMEDLKKHAYKPKNPNEPASDKQKNYLNILGVKFAANITKSEAGKLIEAKKQ